MSENTALRLQERMIERGDDYWVEDERGERVYRVDDRALLIRDAFILRDSAGVELAKVQESEDPHRHEIPIVCQGSTVATVRKRRAGLHHHYEVELADGSVLKLHGHLGTHEYELRRGDRTAASVSTHGFGGHRYGVEVGDGEDEPLLLAATVALDQLTHV